MSKILIIEDELSIAELERGLRASVEKTTKV